MATYFRGNSEIQGGDGLQTLILMNPSYVGYSDTQQNQPPPGNFVFLNSNTAGNSQFQQNVPPPPPHNQTQQFIRIPLHGTTSAAGSDPIHDVSALHGFNPRVHHYNVYNSIDTTAAREVTCAQQGLSLTLSSQQTGHGAEQTVFPNCGDEARVVSGGSPTSEISNGVNGVQGVLLSSKYLKAAQELLDEVVNVGKGIRNGEVGMRSNNGRGKATREESTVSVVAGEGLSSGVGETSRKRGGELTTPERQEIQMKKAKLVNMLDEVEQRYRQYHHQMQIVISWFDQAAGIGSTQTYTALALHTISKQFRCLKDAITRQIQTAGKSLGEEDWFGGGKSTEGGLRFKFVDQQIRQQRAMQQLGMTQPNAWRPQRGLPERSVSVLRAWLFEHFLHPYPRDSDKIMLAKHTGLSRSQVSNWFINARVRLWKPMVEEMYLEETKGSQVETSKPQNNEDPSPPKSHPQQQNQNTRCPAISVSTASTYPTFRNPPGFSPIGSPREESFTQGSSKKSVEILQSASNEHQSLLMRFADGRQSRDGGGGGFTLIGAPTNFIRATGSNSIGEMGRFSTEQFPAAYAGNGVSLTLGLPHCENLSMSRTRGQSFLPNQSIQIGGTVEIGQPDEFCSPISSIQDYQHAEP